MQAISGSPTQTRHFQISCLARRGGRASRKEALEQRFGDHRKEQAIHNRPCLYELPTAVQNQSPKREPRGSASLV